MHKFADFLDKPFTKETKRQFLDFLQNDFLKGSFKPVFDKDGVVADYVSGLSFIKQVNILGSADNLKDLIVLEIIKRNDIGDSRIGLTKEIFKLIANKDFLNKPRFNVLAIVRGEEPSKTWRFSLITSDGDKKSSPKRFSFLLGEGEKVKTVKKSIIEPLGIKDFADLVDRFDVEVVRKEFFALYMDLFLELYGEIKDNDTFKVLIEQGKIEPISFAKNLMGKMIFLYFIQKKGWLGITDPNAKFGNGDRDFFKNNFDNLAHKGNLFRTSTNFYNDFLEPLFYSGLNKKNEFDWNKQLSMKVPYLNGGLFQEEYDWENTVINLNNDIFKSIIDCFDTYNFTIDEDDPIDREIAVDPEMLGKIFESMISVNDENIDKILDSYIKSKKKTKLKELSPDNILSINIGTDINKELGAFYTPREIVKYMTQESLIAYLSEKLSKINNKPIEETEGIMRMLFSYKEKHLSQHEIDEDKVNGYNLIKGYVFDIQKALKQIKILDPAVGSGAFPMGILQEILGLNRYLIDTFDLNDESDFEIKKQIIQNNIHGIDIDPGAVDIARLRFWLSLIVDSEDPVPLPNLDFKFVCANSLIPLDKGGLFVNEEFANNLKDIKDRFFSCCDHIEKENLKKEFMNEKLSLFSIDRDRLNSLRGKDGRITESYKNAIADLAKGAADKKNKQLLDWDPFNTQKSNERFDSKMMFDVENFDIVIGNPPYIQLQKNIEPDPNKPTRTLGSLYENLNFKTFEKRGDIYTLFYEKGFSLLKENGILSYITSNKWMKAGYGKKLRTFFSSYTSPLYLIDLGPGVFDTATVDSNILISKNLRTTTYHLRGLDLVKESNINNIYDYLDSKKVLITNLSGDNRLINSSSDEGIKKKFDLYGTPLRNWDTIIDYGIKTGCNDVFVITKQKKNELLGKCKTKDEKDRTEQLIKPFLRGKDVFDYGCERNDLYVILAYYGSYKILETQYPVLFDYLTENADLLKARGQVLYTSSKKVRIGGDFPGQHHRLELDNNPSLAKIQGYENDKIIYGEISQTPGFCYDTEGLIIGNTGYTLSGKKESLKYLCALLNSKCVTYGFKHFYSINLGKSGYRYLSQYMANLPIPQIPDNEQKKIVDIVDTILDEKKDNKYADVSTYKKEIDKIVYQLYKLTDEEIQIIEEDIK